MTVEYSLYQIVNLVDNSRYIGITNDLDRRTREHWNNPSNKYLKAAIAVYGLSNFRLEVLSTHSRELIDDIEITTIAELKARGLNLYNVAKGGLIGNGSPGEEHWNHALTEQDIINIRMLYASNSCTQRYLAELFGVGYKAISKIIRGDRWKHVEGPITITKQQVSKVANRRKLTDVQVIQVRYGALEEYELTSTLCIPEIAELYGVARGNMRMILKGISYEHLEGPILGRDYYKEFGHGS